MGYLVAQEKQLYFENQPVILRGVGFGGWLNLEGYLWNLVTPYDRSRTIESLIQEILGSEEAKEAFLHHYEDCFITEEDFRYVASLGLNSVRVPFNSRRLWKNGVLVPEEIRHLDDAVKWGKKHHLFVFLDCHAAPGGQTGANIDDTADDFPHLFTEPKYQDELVHLWVALAERYQSEEWVGGYDLLNEPLKPEYSPYEARLLPLYRRLIHAIREVDPHHMLVLEGSHWATDFTPLSGLSPEEMQDNLLFQFHKYWNAPDRESLSHYLAFQKQFNIPLWCGETGENNRDWYALTFPLLEREGIGWCFWAYKKMENRNGFSCFSVPSHWNEMESYSQGGPFPRHGKEALQGLLDSIQHAEHQDKTASACLRLPSTTIPAVSYDDWEVHTPRHGGVLFRETDPVSIAFLDGHQGAPNFHCPAGEPFASEDAMCVSLEAGEALIYHLSTPTEVFVNIVPHGDGIFRVAVDGKKGNQFLLSRGVQHLLRIQSEKDGSRLMSVELNKPH